MPKDDSQSPLSEDSAGYLEDVRKGKPRRFVMICKGSEIVSLVVYKKGSVEKFKKEAKEAGSGAVSYGVVNGKGPNICFQLATADGFDKAPTNEAKLKKFLKESADLKFAPSFEIVASHAPLLDADDPLVARFLAIQPAAQQIAVDQPEQAGAIRDLLSAISGILDQDPSSDAAHAKIGELEALVRRWQFEETAPIKTSAATTATDSTGEPPQDQSPERSGEAPPESPREAPPLPDPEAAKFKARLAEVLKQATPYVATLGGPLKTLATEARDLAAAQKYGEAGERLKQMVELVVKAKNTPPTTGGQEQTSRFTEQVGALKPDIERLKAGDEPAQLRASEAAALVRQAAGFVQKGDFEEAFRLVAQAGAIVPAALKELELRRVASDESLQDSSESWETIAGQIDIDLKALEQEIVAECQRRNDDCRSSQRFDLNDVRAKTKGLYAVTQRLDGRLAKQLTATLAEKDAEKRVGLQKSAAVLANEYLTYLSSGALAAAIEKSKLPSAKLVAEAKSGLQKIVQRLTL